MLVFMEQIIKYSQCSIIKYSKNDVRQKDRNFPDFNLLLYIFNHLKIINKEIAVCCKKYHT